jgi:magnesium-transporting ATPase (P-type)
MGFRKLAEQEDITNQYTNDMEEAVPLTKSPKSPTDEKQQQNTIDDVPAHLEPYLQTKPTFGLTDEQVQERMQRFGRNELEEKKRNKLLHFLSFCELTLHPTSSRLVLSFFDLNSYWSNFILDDIVLNSDSDHCRLARFWYHSRHVTYQCSYRLRRRSSSRIFDIIIKE